MTEIQIRYFEAVCRTLSFSQAANTLYVSQPAISKSISKLEEELGVELFLQTGSGLVLTPAGELFRGFTQKLTQDYDALLQELFRLKTQRGNAVRLGCPETWNPAGYLTHLEACFTAVNPEHRLVIEAHKLSELMQGLQSGELDMVISHDFYPSTVPGLASVEVTSTGAGVLYSPDAFPDTVTFEVLAGAGFLLYDRDFERRFGAVIQEICRRHGVSTTISSRPSMVRALFDVSRGGGVMLFTQFDSVAGSASLRYFPLDFPLPVKLMYMAPRATPQIERFVRAAKNMQGNEEAQSYRS